LANAKVVTEAQIQVVWEEINEVLTMEMLERCCGTKADYNVLNSPPLRHSNGFNNSIEI
jgi:hypothetical protein